jgi:hypothetical protein
MISCKEGKQQLIIILLFPSQSTFHFRGTDIRPHAAAMRHAEMLTTSPIGHIRTWDRPREGTGDVEAASTTAGSKNNKE